MYASPALYIASVQPPVNLGPQVAAAIFALGCLSIWINYDSDRQRQEFRASGGKKKVWGKKPVIVEAEYKVAKDGKTVTKKSILLASGWWAIARHFHYLPEISRHSSGPRPRSSASSRLTFTSSSSPCF